MRHLAKTGALDPYTFGQDYQKLYFDSMQEAQACMQGGAESMRTHGCRAAAQNYQAIQQIPGLANQGWMTQAQIQQQMYMQQMQLSQQFGQLGMNFGGAAGLGIPGASSSFLK